MLQAIGIHLTIRNHNFHKSSVFNSTSFISGGLHKQSSNIGNYFNLKKQNEQLVLENIQLKNKVAFFSSKEVPVEKQSIDSLHYLQKYTYTTAKIIKNEYHKPYNVLLIDKGNDDGIEKEMAVFNSKGIIGITEKTSKNYTRIQSILNKNSGISARLKKGSNYFGPLIWDGKAHHTVQLTDIPRQANVKIGDTVITSGRSTIFPEGVLIGTVSAIGNSSSSDNKISVKLFNDMRNLRHIYVAKNLHKLELKNIENE